MVLEWDLNFEEKNNKCKHKKLLSSVVELLCCYDFMNIFAASPKLHTKFILTNLRNVEKKYSTKQREKFPTEKLFSRVPT